MTAARPAGEEPAHRVDSIFFLSDYGRADEFVGVVHAVLRRLAPSATVIDLTHEVPPFDVRAGSATLVRAVPYLGSGVVLGVVDPGVGSARRGVALEVALEERTLYFVGPDNGLLVAAAEACGGTLRAVALSGAGAGGGPPPASTFDGRDVFAPAAAALCGGVPLETLGSPLGTDRLVRLPGPVWSEGRSGTWHGLRSEIVWVDRFGNVQLAVPGPTAAAAIGRGWVSLEVERAAAEGSDVPTAGPVRFEGLRLVRAFSDLERGELGLLVDANGQLAVVVCEGSAAGRLEVAAGGLIALIW